MEGKETAPREPYEPPAIEEIPIEPEDKVLRTCKGQFGGSGFSNNCSSAFGPCKTS